MATSKEIEVKTKSDTAPDGEDKRSFRYNFADSLDEAKSIFGQQEVFALFTKQLTIAVQGVARNMMKSDSTDEQIQQQLDNWKPGVTVRGARTVRIADPVKQIMDDMDSWTPERIQAMMDQLQARFNQSVQERQASTGEEAESTQEETPSFDEAVTQGEGSIAVEETPQIEGEVESGEEDTPGGRRRGRR
jgi:hypothetical protein